MANNFTEQDIRPKDLVVGQKKALKHDIDFLKSHSTEFVNVNCPACDSNNFIQKFNKYGFNIVECKFCKTFYTNPRPNSELLILFYSQSENYAYWNKYIFPASEKVRKEKIFKKRVDTILEYCKKFGSSTDSILEVGAGFGTFCEELKSRNIFTKIVAIEPTPSLAETCRKKGIETIEKPIEKIFVSDEEKFDVVVNFEVIEHLFSPKEFIQQCKKILKPGGLFVVTCPNGQGFDVVTLKEVSNTLDHEHLNYFNLISLGLLLENCGFEILESLTPGVLDADLVRNAVLEGNYSLDNQEFLKQILINDWDTKGVAFQNFLIDNKLSSNLWIIARNKI